MMQAMFHQFPGAVGEYKFLCRNNIDLLPFKKEIDEELDNLCELQYTEDELNFLSKIRFIKPDFIEFLRLFRLNRNHIQTAEVEKKLDIRAKGPLYMSSPFEIYVLSIVHEVYTKNINYGSSTIAVGHINLDKKIKLLRDYKAAHGIIPTIVDFGTRRRFTKVWQKLILERLIEEKIIVSTSNLMFAKDLGIGYMGTFAHEWCQLFQGLGTCQLRDSQKVAFQIWSSEYRGDLGCCLSDTLGTNKFLKDFDMYFAKLFDSIRHDSGDPFKWGDLMIKHYESMKIDPKTKALVFSDGLDIPTAIKLFEHFKDRIKVSFGIGTNLTNDLGVPALQNVMKLVSVNGNPVAKLSDNPSKCICEDSNFLNYLKSII